MVFNEGVGDPRGSVKGPGGLEREIGHVVGAVGVAPTVVDLADPVQGPSRHTRRARDGRRVSLQPVELVQGSRLFGSA